MKTYSFAVSATVSLSSCAETQPSEPMTTNPITQVISGKMRVDRDDVLDTGAAQVKQTPIKSLFETLGNSRWEVVSNTHNSREVCGY
ncbi:MAG: hypothetical protein ABJ226_02365 [Roseobacter sp.]